MQDSNGNKVAIGHYAIATSGANQDKCRIWEGQVVALNDLSNDDQVLLHIKGSLSRWFRASQVAVQTPEAFYEDGYEVKLGDTGTFAYAADGQGYLYEGTVILVTDLGRLTVEGPVPALLMADQVKFEPVKPQDIGPQVWSPGS